MVLLDYDIFRVVIWIIYGNDKMWIIDSLKIYLNSNWKDCSTFCSRRHYFIIVLLPNFNSADKTKICTIINKIFFCFDCFSEFTRSIIAILTHEFVMPAYILKDNFLITSFLRFVFYWILHLIDFIQAFYLSQINFKTWFNLLSLY